MAKNKAKTNKRCSRDVPWRVSTGKQPYIFALSIFTTFIILNSQFTIHNSQFSILNWKTIPHPYPYANGTPCIISPVEVVGHSGGLCRYH